MAKEIDIKLKTTADPSGVVAISGSLKGLKATAAETSSGVVLSARQINERWREYWNSTKANATGNLDQIEKASQKTAEKTRKSLLSIGAELSKGALWWAGGKITDGLLGGISGAVRKSIGGIRAAIQEAFRFETAIASFKTLTGSIEEARRHVDDLRRFAASNPLTFGDVSQASKTLLSFGVSVNEVMPTIKTLGDISLGNAEKFRMLALAFGQCRSTGRLMGQDLLQMINQGFNPLTVIAQETGRSMAELKDVMGQGGISFEMVAAAFRKATEEGGLFHGALKNAAETGEGMVAKMKDEWDAAVRNVGAAFSDTAKTGIGEMTEALRELNEDGSLENWASRAAESIGTVAKATAGIGSLLAKAWRGVKGTVGTAWAFAAGADQAFGEGASFSEQLARGRETAFEYWNREMNGEADAEANQERSERRKKAKEEAAGTAKAEQEEKKSIREMFEESERARAEEAAKVQAEKDARVRAAAEARAAQDAARERDRLDRELHRRRMDDLRAEISAANGRGAGLQSVASAAQGAFDRAFAMYRDPSRAAAEIGEEKAYARDLDRLHADARRYGGSWRIAELSRLMASGDTEGQAAALAEWRKSRGFTPQVEAMVRASAAERAKTTAEDELRKIEANTAGLAEKLDNLLAMKEGA